jgi:hypothetical protein
MLEYSRKKLYLLRFLQLVFVMTSPLYGQKIQKTEYFLRLNAWALLGAQKCLNPGSCARPFSRFRGHAHAHDLQWLRYIIIRFVYIYFFVFLENDVPIVGYLNGGVNDGAEVFEGPRGGLYFYNRNNNKNFLKNNQTTRRNR